jgi:hypothetical protein
LYRPLGLHGCPFAYCLPSDCMNCKFKFGFGSNFLKYE